MFRSAQLRAVLVCLVCVGATLPFAIGGENSKPAAIKWHTDYGKATETAESGKKMLLVYFQDQGNKDLVKEFDTGALSDPEIVARLDNYICVKLPLDATITSGGKPVCLLQHGSMAEMLGKPGLAIIDYAHPDTDYYGFVVSTFPMLGGRAYSPPEMAEILDLPPGTLTQRTLIYAVRTHPEHPASTCGTLEPCLVSEAEGHSCYQARIRLQGHHNWDSRFRRILSLLPFGRSANEVCAESWPGQGLLEAAIECVRSWRQSSGHWSAVRARQACYGYDMKRGDNGVWYATGIFARR